MEKRRPGRPVTNPLRKYRMTRKMFDLLKQLAAGLVVTYRRRDFRANRATLATVMALQRRGLADGNGAITAAGRSALQNIQNQP